MFALGPMCGVSDPDAVLAASARCDDLGIDTISAGGTIAWAMECAERGLIDAPWLRFGDPAALLRALDEIGDLRHAAWLPARLRDQDSIPNGRRLTPHPSHRMSRAWRCPGTSLARCTPWRLASR